MRLNDDGKTVAAMDVLVPGIGEIIGGSQREERLDVLLANFAKHGLDAEKPTAGISTCAKYGTVPARGLRPRLRAACSCSSPAWRTSATSSPLPGLPGMRILTAHDSHRTKAAHRPLPPQGARLHELHLQQTGLRGRAHPDRRRLRLHPSVARARRSHAGKMPRRSGRRAPLAHRPPRHPLRRV